MNTVIKVNSFVSILLLFFLFTLFNEVTAIAIETRNLNKTNDYCDGFHFKSPKAGDKLLLDNYFTVVWKKGNSKIDEVNGLDLYSNKTGKFVKTLWKGSKKFGADGKASVDVKVEVPKHTQLPADFMFKSWASTQKGPSCFRVSGNFTIIDIII
ncbi:10043_t:CDS:2 [Funneliformis mosseae]|uniref:10043_t:CDS:1 n=1 Tax=Funneliformis mosseae TaxID=27381 RepID=A0A9N9E9V9_FUNMO|nr:10043_t:CDS:2 [Funneliformis mosseae]